MSGFRNKQPTKAGSSIGISKLEYALRPYLRRPSAKIRCPI